MQRSRLHPVRLPPNPPLPPKSPIPPKPPIHNIPSIPTSIHPKISFVQHPIHTPVPLPISLPGSSVLSSSESSPDESTMASISQHHRRPNPFLKRITFLPSRNPPPVMIESQRKLREIDHRSRRFIPPSLSNASIPSMPLIKRLPFKRYHVVTVTKEELEALRKQNPSRHIPTRTI